MKSIREIKHNDRVSMWKIGFIQGQKTYNFLYAFKDGKSGCSVILGTMEPTENGLYAEHASVCMFGANGAPTWDQMCEIKDLIFEPEEECYEIHPKASEYFHGIEGERNPVLHIWHAIDDCKRELTLWRRA